MSTNIYISMETIVCSSCGVTFMIPEVKHSKLIETKDSFYCPNGHSLHFLGKTAAQEIKELKEQLQIKQGLLVARTNELANVKQLLNTKKPCDVCGKRVQDITSHKKRMHK